MKNQIFLTLKFITILSLFCNLFAMEKDSINNNGKRIRDQEKSLQIQTNKKPKIEVQVKSESSKSVPMELEPVDANAYRVNIQNLLEFSDEIKVAIIEQLVIGSNSIEEILKNLSNASRVNKQFHELVRYIVSEDYDLFKLINRKFSVFPILTSPKLFKLFESNLLKLFSDLQETKHLFTSINKENSIDYLNKSCDLKRLQWLKEGGYSHYEECQESDLRNVDKLIYLLENCYQHILMLLVESKLERNDKVSLAKNFQAFISNYCKFFVPYSEDQIAVMNYPPKSKWCKVNFLATAIQLFADNNEKVFLCLETEKNMKNLLSTLFSENDINIFNLPEIYFSYDDEGHTKMSIFESILKTCLYLCKQEPDDINLLSEIIKLNNQKINTLLERKYLNFNYNFGECANHDPIITKFLLDYYASEFLKSQYGENTIGNLLWEAVRLNKIEIVKILIERNVSLDVLNNSIVYFLENFSDRDKIIQYLLENGLNANASDDKGKTALMGAVLNSSENIVKLLLVNGANVNAKDANDRTPLMHAISSKKPYRLPIIKLLFEHGAAATMNDQDKDGNTVLSLFQAKKRPPKRLVEFLKKMGMLN